MPVHLCCIISQIALMTKEEAQQCCRLSSQMLCQQIEEKNISIRALARATGLHPETIGDFMVDCSYANCSTMWQLGPGLSLHSGVLMNISLAGIEGMKLVQANPCPFGLAGHPYCPHTEPKMA